eukprot:Pgem_evm1s3898
MTIPNYSDNADLIVQSAKQKDHIFNKYKQYSTINNRSNNPENGDADDADDNDDLHDDNDDNDDNDDDTINNNKNFTKSYSNSHLFNANHDAINPPQVSCSFDGNINNKVNRNHLHNHKHIKSRNSNYVTEPKKNENGGTLGKILTTFIILPPICSVLFGEGAFVDLIVFVLSLLGLYSTISLSDNLYSDSKKNYARALESNSNIVRQYDHSNNNDDEIDNDNDINCWKKFDLNQRNCEMDVNFQNLRYYFLMAMFINFIAPILGACGLHFLQTFSNGPFMKHLNPLLFALNLKSKLAIRMSPIELTNRTFCT